MENLIIDNEVEDFFRILSDTFCNSFKILKDLNYDVFIGVTTDDCEGLPEDLMRYGEIIIKLNEDLSLEDLNKDIHFFKTTMSYNNVVYSLTIKKIAINDIRGYVESEAKFVLKITSNIILTNQNLANKIMNYYNPSSVNKENIDISKIPTNSTIH